MKIKNRVGVVLFFIFFVNVVFACDFFVSTDQGYFVDWKIGGELVEPGDVICVEAGERSYLKFIGLRGSEEKPIIIKNYNWLVDIRSDHSYGFALDDSRYVRIQWDAVTNINYGFKIKAPNAWSVMSISAGSSDVEINNVEIYWDGIDDSYTAFSAKTDPKCGSEFVRWKFEMKNIVFRDSYIHDINQWLYFGWTFFTKEIVCDWSVVRGHLMQWVEIYNNVIERVWQDGMQISSAVSSDWECLVHDNFLKKTSLKNLYWQKSAITIWWWSKCSVYNNVSIDSKWPWILFFGYAGKIFNNLIVQAGDEGSKVDWIFLDDRSWEDYVGWSVEIYDNTIVDSARNWIRFYNKMLRNSIIHNNLIIRPGALLNTHPNHRSLEEWGVFIYLEKGRIDRENINNWAEINSYLSFDLASCTDNCWLVAISDELLEKIKVSDSFGVNAFQQSDFILDGEVYSHTKEDLQFVNYIIDLIQKKYSQKQNFYKEKFYKIAENYEPSDKIWWVFTYIADGL